MPIHDWTRVRAGIFHAFHTRWIGHLEEALNDGVLPPDYYALSDQVAGEVGPDVLTLQGGSGDGNGDGGAAATSGATVMTLPAVPPRVRYRISTQADQTTRRRRLLIHHASSDDRVVAVLEILSPGNKSSRHALRDFVENAVGVIDRGIGLLVVDLWPPTPRDPQGIHWAIWQEIDETQAYVPPPDKPLTLASYVRGLECTAFVEPIAVADVLTPMPLFLDPEHYVNVPLEETYNETYRRVPARWRAVIEAPPTS
jgi:hypothetical protein